MRVGLFIPCYIDQFHPSVGQATVRLLDQHGIQFEYPPNQTCCGQPLANLGCSDEAQALAEKFVAEFSSFDYVVCPSGSCVSMIRNHYDDLLFESRDARRMREHTLELCEFLHDVVQVRNLESSFPHRVGLHASCHGLRELRMGAASEIPVDRPDKVRALLELVPDLQLVAPARKDECCGFGGTFAVAEEATSIMMGEDRIAQFESVGAEIITATDMSCLMHLDGIVRRQRKSIRVAHVAEILCGAGS